MMKPLAYVNMFNHGINDVKLQLKENNSPEPEFNVNLITVFSVVVREPKVETMGADGSVIENTARKPPRKPPRKLLKSSWMLSKTNQP